MSEEGRFLIYCIEMYRNAKGMSGQDAYELFRSTGADDYLRQSYGALHTTGERYILEDIDDFLANAAKTKALSAAEPTPPPGS